MRHRREAIAAALLGIALIAASAPTRADQVDDYVQSEMKRRQIPGLSLAVVRDGEVVKMKGYGLANVELNVPVTPETIFQSGSVGKQFTATLVMMLAEEGRLSLDDPLGKYIPEAPAAWKDITLRRMLTHTAGLSNDLYKKINLRQDYTEDELVREIAALPLDFPPGEKWNYSNPGYVLLGIVIHKVTGKFYGDVLREKVFEPLGMTTARIISEADIVPNRAAGYRLVNGELKNQEWVSPMLNTTADGALYVTVLDMVKWDAGLASEKLLKRSALDRMWTPVTLKDGKSVPYGFGWNVGELRGHRVVRHGGEWQGFSTHITRYLDKKTTVILLTNLKGVDAGTFANGVAARIDPELAPEEPVAVRIDPKAFDANVGQYRMASGYVLTFSREGTSSGWSRRGSSAASSSPRRRRSTSSRAPTRGSRSSATPAAG
jgi:CubicO group peptidase (beta-lactamase class C family)